MDFRRLFFWIALLASCSFPRTQTIVELRADGRVVSEANNLRVEVLGGTGAVLFARDLNPQGNDFSGFPLLFPVSSRGDDSRAFELRAVATAQRRSLDGSVTTTPVAQNRVRTSFRRGQVLRFTLWLLSGCRCNVESERCEPDADGDLVPECVPIALDVNASDAAVVDSASFADDASVDGAVSETGPMCTAIQRLCGSQCVSRNSPVACGASCARCDSVSGGEPICENDACSIRCGASTLDRCPNACVDFDSDRANCGACGRACAQGQLCVNRDCVVPPQCSMARDTACTGQTYCNLTTRMCAPGCDGRSGQCPIAQMCNTQTNTCVCADGTRTCGSSCVTCPSGANIAVVGCEGDACVVQSCNAGFMRNSANTACIDINECSANNGGCGAGTCSNSEGSFGCSCNAPNRMCGSSCMSCPSDTNATASACNSNSCVISACRSGFSPNQAGSACQATGPGPIFSGAPMAIAAPSGAVSFGYSISVSHDGNALVVGDPEGGGDNYGSVTVYTRSGGVWSSGGNVTRPSVARNFGASVSLSQDGNTLAVGDDDGGSDQNGSATVYTRSAATWSSGTNVTRPSVAVDFGDCVSLSQDGNTLVVGDGDGGDGDRGGSATVYIRGGGTWSSGTDLTRASTARNFGASVSLSHDGNTLVVGDFNGSAATYGTATVYSRGGDTWSSGTSLPRPSGAYRFGLSVSLSQDGNTLAVGDYDGGGDYNGSATVYSRSGGIWGSGISVTRPSGAEGFGTDVSLSGDGNTLVVGDNNGGGDTWGSATIYTRSGGTWSVGSNVTRPSGTVSFGAAVSLSQDGSTLAVGDFDRGTVRVYSR